jgi:flagellar biosynthesis/type III secretory pathway protein FliH
MMSRVQLEVFQLAVPAPASDIVVVGRVELEETRLAAFDKGYAAGWDDATAAIKTDRHKMEDEVARNLQALSFTFQEVRMHLLQGLRPLLTAMIERLLPAMGRDLICQHVVETLWPKAEAILQVPVHIHVHPRARSRLETLTGTAKGLSVKIIEDDILREGQVYLRFGDLDEKLIDIDQAVEKIRHLVNDYFDHVQPERKHA